MMENPTPKADWYEDPNNPNQYRYWNGQEWTEDFAPKTIGRPGAAQVTTPPSTMSKGAKVGIAAVAGVGGLVLIGVAAGSGDSETSTTAQTTSASTAPSSSATTEPGTPEPSTSPSTASAKPSPTRTYKPKPISYKNLSDRDWKLLAKNPDRYAGNHFIVYANVTQFDSATGDDTFRADAAGRDMRSYGFWDGADNALFTGTARQLRNVVAGDVVRAKVTVVGSFSYETQIGGETTVPLFSVDKIQVIGSTD